MKIKVEKGQFRWKVLVFVFFTYAAVFYPITLTFHLMTNLLVNIIIMIALTIPVVICILLQKSWPIKIKLLTILYIIFCFVLLSRVFLIQLILSIFNTVMVHLMAPLVVGILFYYFILRPFHRRYDTDIKYVIIPMPIRKYLLLLAVYIGLFLTMMVAYGGIIATIMGIANSKKTYEGIYLFIAFLLPPSFYTVLFAIPAQFLVLIQKGWSLRTKIINILAIEVVFLFVCSIIVSLSIIANPILYSTIDSFMPFIAFAGGVLLRHIFIKSSLNALERKE